jgi:hypothetical protein
MPTVARAFHLAIVRIEIEQCREVALPAGIHPIDDNSHLIEIAHAKSPVCRKKFRGGLGRHS